MQLTHTGWTRRCPEFPKYAEYIEILPEVGRIICAHVAGCTPGLSTSPLRYVEEGSPIEYFAMPLSYVEVEDGLIRTQIYPWNKGTDHRYLIKENVLYWDDKMDAPWESLSADQFPSWYQAFKEQTQAWMDKKMADYLSRKEDDPRWEFLKS